MTDILALQALPETEPLDLETPGLAKCTVSCTESCGFTCGAASCTHTTLQV